MTAILATAAALFSLGLYGVLVRRDIVGVLASVEVMMAGPLLMLVAFGALAPDLGGIAGGSGYVQAVGLAIIVIAAAEAAVGLALLVTVARTRSTTRMDELLEVGD